MGEKQYLGEKGIFTVFLPLILMESGQPLFLRGSTQTHHNQAQVNSVGSKSTRPWTHDDSSRGFYNWS